MGRRLEASCIICALSHHPCVFSPAPCPNLSYTLSLWFSSFCGLTFPGIHPQFLWWRGSSSLPGWDRVQQRHSTSSVAFSPKSHSAFWNTRSHEFLRLYSILPAGSACFSLVFPSVGIEVSFCCASFHFSIYRLIPSIVIWISKVLIQAAGPSCSGKSIVHLRLLPQLTLKKREKKFIVDELW